MKTGPLLPVEKWGLAELPYSRAFAGALIFSKEFCDIAWGMNRCLARLGALPKKLVWDREGAIHAGGGRPTEPPRGRVRTPVPGCVRTWLSAPDSDGAPSIIEDDETDPHRLPRL